jgi:hypothetical protein
MKLFEYCVVYHPKTEKHEIIVPITQVLASDLQKAMLLAARAIPEEYLNDLENIEVLCRPF